MNERCKINIILLIELYNFYEESIIKILFYINNFYKNLYYYDNNNISIFIEKH